MAGTFHWQTRSFIVAQTQWEAKNENLNGPNIWVKFLKYVWKIVDFLDFKMYENLTVGQRTTHLTQEFFLSIHLSICPFGSYFDSNILTLIS